MEEQTNEAELMGLCKLWHWIRRHSVNIYFLSKINLKEYEQNFFKKWLLIIRYKYAKICKHCLNKSCFWSFYTFIIFISMFSVSSMHLPWSNCSWAGRNWSSLKWHIHNLCVSWYSMFCLIFAWCTTHISKFSQQ